MMKLKHIVSCLIVQLALTLAQNLPGLDYLKSGFDATKIMETTGIGQTKAAIFDLNDSSQGFYDFEYEGKTYKVSQVVQATSELTRKEVTCENVYTSFTDFQKKLTESISIQGGIQIGDIKASLGFNHSLEEIYEKITKEGKSVTMSQSYWSKYSLTNSPAFLMPLNNQFKRALEYLNENVKIPQDQNGQTFYNQVVQAYGTHYVSSIVMGGTAKILTLLNTTYVETHDFQEVKNQVNLEVNYIMSNLNFDASFNQTENTTSVVYQKDAENYIFFTPDLSHSKEEKAWDAWESRVPQNPQPVNITVSYLSDLASSYKEVQQHLRDTIEYYLKNGDVPRDPSTVKQYSFALKQEVPQNKNLRTPLKENSRTDIVEYLLFGKKKQTITQK